MSARSQNKAVFLVLAADNQSPDQGVIGAAIGTETVVQMVSADYDVEWVVLRTNGLGQLSARGLKARLGSMVQAAGVSLEALIRLAWRGLQGRPVSIVYLLPAASTMGVIRNAGMVLTARLFHRRARLVFLIRNGNYFDPMSPWKERLQRFTNARAAQIFVLSRLLLPADLARAGVREDQLCILPNTIDEKLLPDDATPQKRSEIPPLKVLYLSNFIAEKGYLALLSAAEVLVDRGLADRFSFVFEGKWLTPADRARALARAEALRQQGLEIHLGDGVHDRKKVQMLFARHHVFCLPTLYAAEAQPRSVLEAMANGCAVLATHYRSLPEQVLDGETGYLVADQTPDILADRLIRLLEGDPQQMGRAGRAHFEAQYSHATVQHRLLTALHSAAGGRGLTLRSISW